MTTSLHQSHYLFVYGSLRRGFNSPAYQYVSQYFQFVGDATTAGLLYNCGAFPAAVPGPVGGQKIVGELYKITEAETLAFAFAQLDDYEGVNESEGEPALYYRQLCMASLTHEQDEVPAWVYWYNGNVAGCKPIASGDILDYV